MDLDLPSGSALKRPSSEANPTVYAPSVARRKLEMDLDTVPTAPDAATHDHSVETVPGDFKLEFVPDILSDAAHKLLDDKVIEAVGEEFGPRMLLVSIVENSEGRLDSKYGKVGIVKDLLQENQELENMLKAAWKLNHSRTYGI